MDRQKLIDELEEIGRLLRVGDYPAAEVKLEWVLAGSSSEDNADLHWLARIWMAFVNLQSRNVQQAIPDLLLALDVAEQTNDPVLQFWANYVLATYYLDNRQYFHATGYGLKAYQVAKILNDRQKSLIILQIMGILHSKIGELTSAEDYYREWLRLAGDSAEPIFIANNYCNLGYVKYQQGDYRQAIEYTKKAIGMFQRSKAEFYLANCYLNMGQFLRDMRRFEEARNYLNQSRELFSHLGEQLRVMQVQEAEGKLLIKEGKTTEGLHLLRQVQRAYVQHSVPEAKDLEKYIQECSGY
jgi:tetratricopeptide (TPR) repeat protein